jgi:hypothetical protein
MFLKKEKRKCLEVSSMECRILIHALLGLRESQIEKGKAHDIIDDLIVKICDMENECSE